MTKAERTRQFIIEKTAPVFNMKGFSGTSLSDLTEATGLTKGSIYGNFSDKDEVAVAVFEYNIKRLNSGINAAAASGANTIDKLLKMAEFHREQFKTSASRGGCPILNTAIDADDTHPLLKDKVARSIRAWKENIEKIVQEGIVKKEIKSSVNAAEFSTEFISLVEGGIMLAKATNDIALLSTAVNRVKRIINSELKI